MGWTIDEKEFPPIWAIETGRHGAPGGTVKPKPLLHWVFSVAALTSLAYHGYVCALPPNPTCSRDAPLAKLSRGFTIGGICGMCDESVEQRPEISTEGNRWAALKHRV